MIVMTRRINESVMIGHDVKVTVVEVRGDKVRLGVDHPPDIPVHREEILEQIRSIEAESKEG